MPNEKELEKIFSSPVRLRIMAALVGHSPLTFNDLLEHLGVTRGNLSSHVKALEKHNMLTVTKEFVANKPKTSYNITSLGSQSFTKYVGLLASIIASTKGN